MFSGRARTSTTWRAGRNLLAPDLGRVLILLTPDSDLDFDFGEIWQGEGLTHDLAAAAFCSGDASALL